MRAMVFAAAGLVLMCGAVAAQDRPLSPKQAEGKALYAATCVYCHGPRGYGTEALAARLGAGKGVLDGRSDLNAEYIRAIVRQGLGNMPAYTPTDLTEDQIAAVGEYLMRNNPR